MSLPPRPRGVGKPRCGQESSWKSHQHGSCAPGRPSLGHSLPPWLGSRSPAGIPLAHWDPAHPLLTQSLGHVDPLGGVCRVLPAKSRAPSHAPLLQQTQGCCLGAWWDCPAPGMGASFGVPRGDGYIRMGGAQLQLLPRRAMLPDRPWAQELADGRQGATARVSSPTQNMRPRRSPPAPKVGLSAMGTGSKGLGAGAQGPSTPRRLRTRSYHRPAQLGPRSGNPEKKLTFARMVTSTLNQVRDVGFHSCPRLLGN